VTPVLVLLTCWPAILLGWLADEALDAWRLHRYARRVRVSVPRAWVVRR
jgi:hypothetical protein